MSKILLIGSRQNKYDATDTGGVTILFELLIAELINQKIDLTIIDTLKVNNGGGIKTFLMAITKMLKYIPKHKHVSLHATPNSFLYLAPITILFTKIFNKKLSIRLFAGDFFELYQNYGFIRKSIIRFSLKNSHYLFFELKSLVQKSKKYNKNTYWFPNVRNQDIQNFQDRIFNKRFVYIGSINQEKGIDELCEAIQNLDEDIICDLYGPLKYENEKYSKSYFKNLNISYKGSLKKSNVLKVMNNYDVLVLPSHREGYPGIIIEAFSQGIPVITTNLLGIMEMCKNNIDSILIDVKNTQQLLEAMHSINKEKYESLHYGAKKAFSNFDSTVQTNLFLQKINYLR